MKLMNTPAKAIRIVVFAKAPLPGLAKTRLIPALGAEGAARLAGRLLVHTIEQALAANVGPVELCVAPTIQHPVWQQLMLSNRVHWTTQRDGDLGERLARATQRVTDKGEAILMIGADCPALNAETIRAAALALQRHDACMVPVTDGGYALLGLNHLVSSVFIDIPWSTPKVADLTRKRLLDQHYRLHELKVLHDIDTPADLKYLPAKLRQKLGESH